jgi:hypothetical protein
LLTGTYCRGNRALYKNHNAAANVNDLFSPPTISCKVPGKGGSPLSLEGAILVPNEGKTLLYRNWVILKVFLF